MTSRRREALAHYRQHGGQYCMRCARFREWAVKYGHKELL